MKVSNRTDYALRALFAMVAARDGALLSSRQLSEQNDIPKKFLEQILMELKAKGWVASVPGPKGGYRLAKPPGKITMGEVIRHFDGILAPIACVSASGQKCCSQEAVCRFRRVFLQVRNRVAGIMDRADLESVFRGDPVSKAEVLDLTFTEGGGI